MAQLYVWYIALLAWISQEDTNVCLASKTTAETELIRHLFSKYNKLARPVKSQNIAIQANMDVNINKLLQVNEREQVIKTRLWIRQTWKNDLLTWNSNKWNNITTLHTSPDSVWLPDIVLYNAVGDKFPGGTEIYKTDVSLSSDGQQNWNSPVEIKSSCTLNIQQFPFDKHSCFFKFGSWAYDQTDLDLYPGNGSLISNEYKENSEWQIIPTKTVRNVVKYACCKHPYIDVHFHFDLKRKPMFHVFNLIIPCLLLLPLMSVTFYLPPESGERISLTITILLAVSVFLQITSDALPRNADHVPFVAIFFISIMVTSAMSLIMTAIVLVIHFKGDAVLPMKAPKWMKKLLLGKLARFLGIKEADVLYEMFLAEKQAKLPRKSCITITGTYDNGLVLQNEKHDVTIVKEEGVRFKRLTGEEENHERPEWKQVLNQLNEIFTYIQERDRTDLTSLEWKVMARVLDKLTFVCFMITNVMIIASIGVPVLQYF